MDQPEMTKRYDIDGYEDITCSDYQNIDVLGYYTINVQWGKASEWNISK